MKINKRILTIFSLLIIMSFSTSCLKDEPLFNWDDMKSVVELPYKNHYLRASSVTPAKNVQFELLVNYTVPYKEDNTEDISVTLDVRPDMLADYNTSLGASGTYIILPSSTYTIPSLVIKAGTRLSSSIFEINTSSLQAGKKYLLPIVIKSVSGGKIISGNFGHLYLRVDMK